jgi:hypothetical protein
MLDFIIKAAIVIIVIIFALKIFQRITFNITKGNQVKEIDPTTTGERLKKYLIKAGKINPKTAKIALLSRTNWSEGGKISNISGCLPTKNCTRFILKSSIFGKRYLMYCPTDLHSSLHNKEVIIFGVGIENAGGYYYPLPNGNKMNNYDTFKIVSKQFESDLRKMLTMDSLQMELEQTYRGIAGMGREKEFYDERENIVEYERVKDTGAYDEN